jgi:citrate lyase subunit beta/citryl-CoA lyase
MTIARSWLFVPGHRADMLTKAHSLGADVIVIDLEDGVPIESRAAARENTRHALASLPAWVRINRAGTEAAAADLDAIGDLAVGIRLPKTEDRRDVQWVRERLPSADVGCTIESAKGVTGALGILSAEGVTHASFGASDLAAELCTAPDSPSIDYARVQVVFSARAAGVKTIIDGAFTLLNDPAGLRAAALRARTMGYSGKSAVHPGQIAILNEVFSPSEAEIAWARDVVAAFASSSSNPTRSTGTGELVDPPVVARAQTILEAIHE